MKAYYLLAPIAAVAFAGCTVVRPVAYQPVVTTPAAVTVTPSDSGSTTYVAPAGSTLLIR